MVKVGKHEDAHAAHALTAIQSELSKHLTDTAPACQHKFFANLFPTVLTIKAAAGGGNKQIRRRLLLADRPSSLSSAPGQYNRTR
jgi:hypothetical protein